MSPKVPLAGVLAVAEGTNVAGRNLVSLYFALRRPEVFSLLVNLQVFPSPECFITEIAVRPVRLQVSLEGAWLERFLTKLTDKSLGRPASVIFIQVRVAKIFRQKSRDLRTEVALINQIQNSEGSSGQGGNLVPVLLSFVFLQIFSFPTGLVAQSAESLRLEGFHQIDVIVFP